MADVLQTLNETSARFVIASEAKQSSATFGILDCRVASLLAMTRGVDGNDVRVAKLFGECDR